MNLTAEDDIDPMDPIESQPPEPAPVPTPVPPELTPEPPQPPAPPAGVITMPSTAVAALRREAKEKGRKQAETEWTQRLKALGFDSWEAFEAAQKTPPKTAIGHSHDENQVSSASASCVKLSVVSCWLLVLCFAKINAVSMFSATTKSSFPSP